MSIGQQVFGVGKKVVKTETQIGLDERHLDLTDGLTNSHAFQIQ